MPLSGSFHLICLFFSYNVLLEKKQRIIMVIATSLLIINLSLKFINNSIYIVLSDKLITLYNSGDSRGRPTWFKCTVN